MDHVALGKHLRALRIRRELRQQDVGRVARLSRAVISRIERGMLESVTVGVLVRVAAALGASIDIRVRWNGEHLDRLLDEAHAQLVELVVLLLRSSGWEVAVEVSFSVWGERGSIDVFAFHRATGIVLVVEVKSVVPDSQSMLHGLDRKTRLARQLAMDRGWACRGVARLLVIGASATSRRRVQRLESTYAVAFPLRGAHVRRWLRTPHQPISGLLFFAYAPRRSGRSLVTGRQRVRRPIRAETAATASPESE